MKPEDFYRRACDAIQFLDELGGPDPRDYIKVMRQLAKECETRAQRCESTIKPASRHAPSTRKPASCPECDRSFGPHYRGPCEH